MKFCTSHWEDLKIAIKERGMWSLVAVSGEVAMANMKADLEGKASAKTYDPLMAAHWMIAENALKCGGLDIMVEDKCPLCEAEKGGGEGTAKNWITGCCDSIFVWCKQNHLLGDN